jgi:hypothetical protein
MTADLDAVARADGVGVVHHPGAEPQDAPLDAVEKRELGARRSA